MLSFFRRLTQSKAGLVVVFAVLAIIAVAFAMSDVTGLRHAGSGAGGGDTVVTIGKRRIADAELRQRVEGEFQRFQQQQPGLQMAEYVAGGGFEGSLSRLIDGIAINVFGERQGMRVSKASVDQQIASLPSLKGPDGKFSQQVYDRLLAARRLTDKQIREDFAQTLMTQRILVPLAVDDPAPRGLAAPYADLLLERRSGRVGFVPAKAMPAGAAPTDAEITAYYGSHLADFTVPERRIVRYAVVKPDAAGASAPTDAEVAAAYRARATQYAPTQKATGEQVIVGDQATATALAAKVRAGTPIADAARAAGLESSRFEDSPRASFAQTTSPDLAAAVFAAAPGAVVGPIRTAFGFGVVKVGAVTAVPGKTIDQARSEIVAGLTRDKQGAALARLRDGIGDAIENNSTFDELVADRKLTALATPALTANGLAPDQPAYRPDQALAIVVQAGFAADPGDDPQLVPFGPDGGFAIVSLARVVPAAPRPLATVRNDVVQRLQADRAVQAARRVAGDVLAAVNRGTDLPAALAATGRALPAPQPLAAQRAELAAAGKRVPPPLALLFSIPQGAARLLEAPNESGWLIVKLDRIVPGNAGQRPAVVAGVRTDLAKALGAEYLRQFAAAVRADVGVTRDDAAIARTKAALAGGTAR